MRGRRTIIDDDVAVMHMECLRTERLDRGMSLWNLAYAARIPSDTITNWEKCRCFPIPENYNRLAEVFGWPKYRSPHRQSGVKPQAKEESKSPIPRSNTKEEPFTLRPELVEALTALGEARGQSPEVVADDILTTRLSPLFPALKLLGD